MNRISDVELLELLRISPDIIDDELLKEINLCIDLFYSKVNFYDYSIVVIIEETNLVNYTELNGCKKVLLGACSLNQEAVSLINDANSNGDYVISAVYDCLCNYTVLNCHCEDIGFKINEYAKNNIYLTKEITPGNNADITLQKEIFRHIDAKNISLTEECLMVPVKSLSYIYGLTDKQGGENNIHNCAECSARHCTSRRDNKVVLTIINGSFISKIDIKPNSKLRDILAREGYCCNYIRINDKIMQIKDCNISIITNTEVEIYDNYDDK